VEEPLAAPVAVGLVVAVAVGALVLHQLRRQHLLDRGQCYNF
jgi:hypothetical protein